MKRKILRALLQIAMYIFVFSPFVVGITLSILLQEQAYLCILPLYLITWSIGFEIFEKYGIE